MGLSPCRKGTGAVTTHRLRRCAHCRITYSYQSSGEGCQHPLNDGRYCPECMEVVLDALKGVPVRVECVWHPTDEIDLDTLLEWDADLDKHVRENPLGCRRVSAPLFRMDGGDVTEKMRTALVPGRGEHKGKTFKFMFWPSKPEEAEVTVEMEHDLETGEMRPWRNL